MADTWIKYIRRCERIAPPGCKILVPLPSATNQTNQKGFTLVEVVIAFFIATLVLTTMLSVTVFTLRSSQTGRNKAVAEASALQVLEEVKQVRERKGWYYLKVSADIPDSEWSCVPDSCSYGHCWEVDSTSWTISDYVCDEQSDLPSQVINGVPYFKYLQFICYPKKIQGFGVCLSGSPYVDTLVRIEWNEKGRTLSSSLRSQIFCRKGKDLDC